MKKQYFYLLLIFTTTFSVFSQSAQVGSTTNTVAPFITSFEDTSDLDATPDAWRADINPNDATIVTDGTAREGKGYLKLTNGNGNIRSELVQQYKGNIGDDYLDWGKEYWIGFSIRINTPVSGYRILSQFRPYGNNGSNAFTLQNNANNTLSFKWATNPLVVDDIPGTSAVWEAISYDTTYTIGEWVDVVMHFKLDPKDGFLQIWADGNSIVDIANTTTTYTKHHNGSYKSPRNYIKIGPYYGPDNVSADVDFDAYKLYGGALGSYEIVSPVDNTTPEVSCSNDIQNEDNSISLGNQGVNSWDGSKTIVAVSDNTNNSPCALKIKKNTTGNLWARYHIPIPLNNNLNAGDQVIISIDGNNIQGNTRFQVVADNKTGGSNQLVNHTFGQGWSTSEKTFTIPQGLNTIDIWLFPNFGNTGTGEAIFDNLSVSKVNSSASLKISKSLFDIEANVQEDKVSVFPNPSSNEVHVLLDTTSKYLNYSLHSISGSLMKEGAINENQMELNLDISTFDKGVYTLSILDNKGENNVTKIIKK